MAAVRDVDAAQERSSDPAGSVVHVTLDLLGQPYSIELDLLVLDPPRRWRHRTNETDVRGYVEYVFDAEDRGTRVTMTMDVRPVGWYGWLAIPLMLLRRQQPYAEQLAQLKRALESRSRAS